MWGTHLDLSSCEESVFRRMVRAFLCKHPQRLQNFGPEPARLLPGKHVRFCLSPITLNPMTQAPKPETPMVRKAYPGCPGVVIVEVQIGLLPWHDSGVKSGGELLDSEPRGV